MAATLLWLLLFLLILVQCCSVSFGRFFIVSRSIGYTDTQIYCIKLIYIYKFTRHTSVGFVSRGICTACLFCGKFVASNTQSQYHLIGLDTIHLAFFYLFTLGLLCSYSLFLVIQCSCCCYFSPTLTV